MVKPRWNGPVWEEMATAEEITAAEVARLAVL